VNRLVFAEREFRKKIHVGGPRVSKEKFIVTYTAAFTKIVHADSEREAVLGEAAEHHTKQDASPGMRGMQFIPGSVQTVRIVPEDAGETPEAYRQSECGCPRNGVGGRIHFCGKEWPRTQREREKEEGRKA